LPYCNCDYFVPKETLIKLFPDQEKLINKYFDRVVKYNKQRVEKNMDLLRELRGNLGVTPLEKILEIDIKGMTICMENKKKKKGTENLKLGCKCSLHATCLVFAIQ